jgi:large subunit ribosomal protein L14e
MFDVGRLCIKVAGREAGKYCVVVKKLEDNFVLVTGPRSVTHVKRRKCNILHLEPLKESLKIKADASDEEVISAYEEASIFTKLDLPRPAIKTVPEQEAEKVPAPKKEKKARKKKEAE